MEKCTTFWKFKTNSNSNSNSNLIRVLYVSPTSWSKTMMADINRTDVDEQITLYKGEDESCRATISKFIMERFLDSCSYMQMSQVGDDRFIIDEAIGIIDKNNESNEYSTLKLHIISALQYNYYYINARYWPEDDIKTGIDFIFKSEHSIGERTDAFYCGITNDLDIRMQQHREEDFEILNNKVYAWICPTTQVAAEIESWAHKPVGISIGKTHNKGNGGKDDSIIVYLLKKGNLVAKE